MKYDFPTRTLRLFCRLTCVIEPITIEEVARAVWANRRYLRRHGVDNQAQIALVRLQGLFCAFAVVDVERGHIPPIDSSLLIEQRIVSDQEPAVSAVFTQHTLLIFERYATGERLPAFPA